jgi:hypothetical protein
MRTLILAAAAIAAFAAAPALAMEGTYAPAAVASGFEATGKTTVLAPNQFNNTENGNGGGVPSTGRVASPGRISGSFSFTPALANG